MALTKKRLAALVGAAVMATTATLGIASPAQAAYDAKYCNINGLGWECTTIDIPPHSSQHWVKVTFDAKERGCGVKWKVYDTGNGVLVGSGDSGSEATISKTIYGLYGRYKAYFVRTGGFPCGGEGAIRNFT
ncbi:hypothetical protein Rhe02_28580 [Rhizocola hellebori]|uniref:Uncharacterized protein n=1 Tax=Rhizocola hellebori TaxID=1392758 RepID=A0A8J3Q7S1_9ACTN|nr:hypothetical protein [Rhizocola hellebori]GIH04791.1 hypothetical protein Rhe02_28580 [Rhizocola hellebori]